MQRKTDHTAEEYFLAFREGEERGFDYYFHLNYKPLLRFAFSIVNNISVAEDVVEDCFINLWKKRKTIASASAVKSFLYTSVRNASVDHLRKEKRGREYAKYIQKMDAGIEGDVTRKIVAGQSREQVSIALKKLPPKHRRVIEMIYIEEKKLKEVADEMKIPLSTVKSRKIKALELLRKLLPHLGIYLMALLKLTLHF